MDEIDLDSAAKAGVIGEDQAIALRNFMARRIGVSNASQEKFELASSLADVTRAIGCLLLLVGTASAIGQELYPTHWRTQSISEFLSALAFGSAILLSLLAGVMAYAARRRGATYQGPATVAAIMIGGSLCAILLVRLLAMAMEVMITRNAPDSMNFSIGEAAIVVLVLTSFLAVLWRHTRFPMIPSFWALMIIYAVNLQFPEFTTIGSQVDYSLPNLISLIAALPVLIAAIWVDLTDIRRETRRGQIAFWLHVVAGVLLARASFGLASGANWSAMTFFGHGNSEVLYLGSLLAVISLPFSLVLDRRSMLVSMMLPLGASFGAVGFGVIGGTLLIISSNWHRWRSFILGWLPTAIVAQLPRQQIVNSGQRPSRRHLELEPRRAHSSTH